MKCSICTVVTGLLVVGALGAATYKTVTGNCVFGSCSTSVDQAATVDPGGQLVGLTDESDDSASTAGVCVYGADGCLVADQVAAGDAAACADGECEASCPADASDCQAHPTPELVALSPDQPEPSSDADQPDRAEDDPAQQTDDHG